MKLSQMEKLSHHHFCCRHTMVQIGGQKPIGDGLLKTPRDEEVNTTNFWYRWMCACACEWMSLMYRDTSTNTHYIHVHSRTCTRFERVAPNEPITWFIWRVCVCVCVCGLDEHVCWLQSYKIVGCWLLLNSPKWEVVKEQRIQNEWVVTGCICTTPGGLFWYWWWRSCCQFVRFRFSYDGGHKTMKIM